MGACPGWRFGTNSLVVVLTAMVTHSTVLIGRMMGIFAHPARRSKRIRSQCHDARGVQPRADEPDRERTGITDLEAEEEPNTSSRRSARPKGAGSGPRRGRCHARHDLRPDHRPREAPHRRAPLRGWWHVSGHRAGFGPARSISSEIQERGVRCLEDYPDLRVMRTDVAVLWRRRCRPSRWPGRP